MRTQRAKGQATLAAMEPGTILDQKYRLISVLGRGGMGSVWRALHLDLDSEVALKLVDPSIATDADALNRFRREARAAASLRSPHVVQVLDHGIDEATGQPFIAMELLDGESLGQRLSRMTRLSPQETVRIMTHVARAMGRAHDANIVHRDLKPDNIFLVRNDDEEIAKVLDFGIAKAASGVGLATRTGAIMGTPYYMSPEQIGAAKCLDYRADLWALGVIACECLTGKRPFEADTIGQLVLRICVEPPIAPSRLGMVPAGFDAWFARATSRNVSERFGSAREQAEALRAVCAPGQPLTAPSVSSQSEPSARTFVMPLEDPRNATNAALARSAVSKPASAAKSKRAPLALGAFAVAALVAGLAWQRGSQQSPATATSSAPAAATAAATVPEPSQAAPLASVRLAPPSPVAAASATLPAVAGANGRPAPRPTVSKPKPATARKETSSLAPATKAPAANELDSVIDDRR